ncbi:hypothetical protein H6G54_22315 [Anabaena cylindrica FACHB-243]|uniref:Uncharacterized protein n=1 Tax=Anabaena cylindrica (strain ATCC 27899 / PCC 7122) TaxID=272123 RepID=K9ZQD8_ANACC|nr:MULTISPECIES: hypothetical protein [Anabaena]AFZ61391.1 hypothetical protein Anacy_6120 [Anabaena cylindrica PCC 7122]MBD2420388.1 hypothetical protein [Anabaena cylindrica FACHB-243]MBY5281880.1 hypothetical protein [Anabaena sp. CCAP 1446/1C]MBY5306971.1 hypothetical protein [Anabaena sp. CCAP 1446/1C]MCM2405989.1 hypothetical protein [Anabaena sp. CCAP 1446/1C]
MTSQPERKQDKTSSFLLRLTPAEKSRWHKMAEFYALPLAEFIRRRVEGRPISPPKVPAINVKTSLQMGQVDLRLRHLEKDLQTAIALLSQKQPLSKPTYQQLIKQIGDVDDLLGELRSELREVRLQLSGVDDNSENEASSTDELDFDDEDWN